MIISKCLAVSASYIDILLTRTMAAIIGGSDDQFSSVSFTLTVFLGDKEIRCEPPQLEYRPLSSVFYFYNLERLNRIFFIF